MPSPESLHLPARHEHDQVGSGLLFVHEGEKERKCTLRDIHRWLQWFQLGCESLKSLNGGFINYWVSNASSHGALNKEKKHTHIHTQTQAHTTHERQRSLMGIVTFDMTKLIFSYLIGYWYSNIRRNIYYKVHLKHMTFVIFTIRLNTAYNYCYFVNKWFKKNPVLSNMP